jgi:hypothetical protein
LQVFQGDKRDLRDSRRICLLPSGTLASRP